MQERADSVVLKPTTVIGEVSVRVQRRYVDGFVSSYCESVTATHPALYLIVRGDSTLYSPIKLVGRHVPRLDVGSDGTVLLKFLLQPGRCGQRWRKRRAIAPGRSCTNSTLRRWSWSCHPLVLQHIRRALIHLLISASSALGNTQLNASRGRFHSTTVRISMGGWRSARLSTRRGRFASHSFAGCRSLTTTVLFVEVVDRVFRNFIIVAFSVSFFDHGLVARIALGSFIDSYCLVDVHRDAVTMLRKVASVDVSSLAIRGITLLAAIRMNMFANSFKKESDVRTETPTIPVHLFANIRKDRASVATADSQTERFGTSVDRTS